MHKYDWHNHHSVETPRSGRCNYNSYSSSQGFLGCTASCHIYSSLLIIHSQDVGTMSKVGISLLALEKTVLCLLSGSLKFYHHNRYTGLWSRWLSTLYWTSWAIRTHMSGYCSPTAAQRSIPSSPPNLSSNSENWVSTHPDTTGSLISSSVDYVHSNR